jgi:hypothetical protein
MGLPWVRLDTQWPQNPKFLMLVEDKKWHAIAMYMAGLAYSGAHGTAGFLPFYALPTMHGTRKEAQQLVEMQLWHLCEGGYEINDWSDYQPSNEENEARSKRARDAALIRWHGKSDARRNARGNARRID